MSKIAKIVFATSALLTLSAPVLAGPFGDGNAEERDFAATGILATLQQRGVPATAVEEYGTDILAFVTTDNGTEKMVILDATTLEPITH